MEWLSSFAGSSGLPALITVLLIVLIVLFAVKMGWVSFKGHGLEIGESKDRSLIRNQFEYVDAICNAKFVKLHEHIKDEYLCKHIIDKVIDLFQLWVVVNNMSDDENYVKAKQALVYSAILKRTDDPWVAGEDFKACCNRFVNDLIRDLVRMKRAAL